MGPSELTRVNIFFSNKIILYFFAQNTSVYFLRDSDTYVYSLTIDAKDNIYVCV